MHGRSGALVAAVVVGLLLGACQSNADTPSSPGERTTSSTVATTTPRAVPTTVAPVTPPPATTEPPAATQAPPAEAPTSAAPAEAAAASEAAPPPAAPVDPAPAADTGTDPRFTTCKEATAHGYGPYVQGQDPEYAWYRDADHDGTVCES